MQILFFSGLMVIIWTEPPGKTEFIEDDNTENDEVELTGFLEDERFYDDDDDLKSLEGQD